MTRIRAYAQGARENRGLPMLFRDLEKNRIMERVRVFHSSDPELCRSFVLINDGNDVRSVYLENDIDLPQTFLIRSNGKVVPVPFEFTPGEQKA